jgi:hypothetical protein
MPENIDRDKIIDYIKEYYRLYHPNKIKGRRYDRLMTFLEGAPGDICDTLIKWNKKHVTITGWGVDITTLAEAVSRLETIITLSGMRGLLQCLSTWKKFPNGVKMREKLDEYYKEELFIPTAEDLYKPDIDFLEGAWDNAVRLYEEGKY